MSASSVSSSDLVKLKHRYLQATSESELKKIASLLVRAFIEVLYHNPSLIEQLADIQKTKSFMCSSDPCDDNSKMYQQQSYVFNWFNIKDLESTYDALTKHWTPVKKGRLEMCGAYCDLDITWASCFSFMRSTIQQDSFSWVLYSRIGEQYAEWGMGWNYSTANRYAYPIRQRVRTLLLMWQRKGTLVYGLSEQVFCKLIQCMVLVEMSLV